MSREAKMLADELFDLDVFDGLATLLRGVWLRAAAGGLGLAEDSVGPVLVDLTDPQDRLRAAVDRECVERIVGIEEATRRRVQGYVDRAVTEGMSPGGLAKLIAEDSSGAFSRSRAMVIARTETGTAYNKASVEGYRRSGLVERVMVFDGDECSWPEGHGEEPFADGMVVELGEAEEYPLAHPNCVRAFAPVVDALISDAP